MGLILVIDDQAEVRDELTQVLESAEHEVLVAEDGRGGLEAAKNFAPDVVILDINMSSMDGFEVLKHFREDRTMASLPVIMTTDRPNPKEKRQALEMSVVDYMPKPILPVDIELRVKWALKAGSTVPAVPWDQVGAELKKREEESDSKGGGGGRSAAAAAQDAEFNAEPGESVRAITPEEGGTVEIEDGAMQVEVPAGAVPDTIGLHVKRGDQSTKPEPGVMRMRVGKNVADIRLSDKTGAAIGGLKLKKSATIGIKVSEEELRKPDAERLMRVQEWDHETGKWVDLITNIDMASGMAYAEKTRFPRTVKKRRAARVLVLDPSDREYAKIDAALEGSGFRVLRETIPSKIKSRILKDRPVVAILGLILAGQQGMRILREIKADRITSQTSVILIGHPDDPAAYAGAINLGARDVVSGPVQMGELQYRIGRAYEAARDKQRRLDAMGAAPPHPSARKRPRPISRPDAGAPAPRTRPAAAPAASRPQPAVPGRRVRRDRSRPAA
ncbi:MAG: response regulator transcription factor [Chloroflexi bacterium]|nr:response regulator transcription factor [Chloroflexota bacterium]